MGGGLEGTSGRFAGNTLNAAYDEGGAGAGRIINVDSGPVFFDGGAVPGTTEVIRLDGYMTLEEQALDPAAVPFEGHLYTKPIAGATQLFYQDDLGVVFQITPGGALNNSLDQAYDQGGAGAGRTITVDSGPVQLDVDATQADPRGLYLDIDGVIGAGLTGRGIHIDADGVTAGVGEIFYGLHLDATAMTIGGLVYGIFVELPAALAVGTTTGLRVEGDGTVVETVSSTFGIQISDSRVGFETALRINRNPGVLTAGSAIDVTSSDLAVANMYSSVDDISTFEINSSVTGAIANTVFDINCTYDGTHVLSNAIDLSVVIGSTGAGYLGTGTEVRMEYGPAAAVIATQITAMRGDVSVTNALATITDAVSFEAIGSEIAGAMTNWYGYFVRDFITGAPGSDIGVSSQGATAAYQVATGAITALTVNGRWFEDGDMVLGGSAMNGLEILFVVGTSAAGASAGILVAQSTSGGTAAQIATGGIISGAVTSAEGITIFDTLSLTSATYFYSAFDARTNHTAVAGGAVSSIITGLNMEMELDGAGTITDLIGHYYHPIFGGAVPIRGYGVFIETTSTPITEIGGHFSGAEGAVQVGTGTPAVPVVNGRWFDDGDLVLGGSAMSGTERLRVIPPVDGPGILINALDGIWPAIDANERQTISGRIEQGAPAFYDEFSGRVWLGQWATDSVNNNGDVNVVAPATDDNGRSRVRTDPIAGVVMERHWNDIFDYDSDEHTTIEFAFVPQGTVGTDFQLEIGLIDAAETTYARVLCDFNVDTSWHAQSSAAGVGTMDVDTGIAAGSGTYIRVRIEIIDNGSATGLTIYIDGALVATTDAINEIPASGVKMQPYIKATTRAGGGGVRTEYDIDRVKTWNDTVNA